MKIKFAQNVELEIVTDIIDDVPETKNEVFLAGDAAEFDVIDGAIGERSEIQFGDGSVCFVTESFWGAVVVEDEMEMA